MKRTFAALSVAIVVVGATIAYAIEDRTLDFPATYKAEFIKYYSGDRLLADQQTIALYANKIATDGVAKDGKLPSGSVLVAEIFAAMKDTDGQVIESILGRRIPHEFKAIAVMELRDGWGKQYPEDLNVGDWEFELFSPAGKNLGKDTAKACRECHVPLGDTQYLFSLEHLIAAAK
jgi:hypothetical protein